MRRPRENCSQRGDMHVRWDNLNETSIDGHATYENWAFDCHSMHLYSIRRSHYCSLESHQHLINSSGCRPVAPAVGGKGEDGVVTSQTGTGRIPGPWLEQNIPKGVTRDCMEAA